MSQAEVDALFNQRNRDLVLHELDRVFGKNNILSRHFIRTGEIQITHLARALLRQQYHNMVRLERIEAKLGITWDPLSLDAKPSG
jgi:hypothetical protein